MAKDSRNCETDSVERCDYDKKQKASKQRLSQSEAPMHVKRKRMRARLVSDDPDLINIRTVTVRVGDEIEILRGDFGHPNSAKSDTRGKRLDSLGEEPASAQGC